MNADILHNFIFVMAMLIDLLIKFLCHKKYSSGIVNRTNQMFVYISTDRPDVRCVYTCCVRAATMAA